MLLKMAVRNLARNRRRTLITMSAIALGMAMMDVTICMQHGAYQSTIRRGVGALAGHVVVQAEGYELTGERDLMVNNSTEVSAQLQAIDPGGLIVRRTFMGGLLTSTNGSAPVGVSAIEPANSQLTGAMDEFLIDGQWVSGDRDIVIGQKLKENLDVDLGDKVVFMTQADDEMTSRLFRVKGIFRTGAADQDGFLVLFSLSAAQAVLGRPDAATQVTLHLDNPDEWPEAVSRSKETIDTTGVEVLSWKEALPDIDAFIQADRRIGQGMISILGIIVAMGVFNTFLMSVLERTREFGVLLSIGMRPSQLARLVLLEGAVLGAFSIIIGTGLGVALTWPMVEYGIDFSEEYGEGMSNAGVIMSMVIHSSYNWPRMIVFGIGGFFLTLLAAAWPAWTVSTLEPVPAMRQQQ
jgi:ABC-type lipoprotein release transport system permease subunit